MIAEAALSEHLSSLGMRAGNAELRKELESIEGFVLPDGTLSKQMVLQALNNTGLTRKDFMDQNHCVPMEAPEQTTQELLAFADSAI